MLEPLKYVEAEKRRERRNLIINIWWSLDQFLQFTHALDVKLPRLLFDLGRVVNVGNVCETEIMATQDPQDFAEL
jgi:hypothetical protein